MKLKKIYQLYKEIEKIKKKKDQLDIEVEKIEKKI